MPNICSANKTINRSVKKIEENNMRITNYYLIKTLKSFKIYNDFVYSHFNLNVSMNS